MVWNMCCCGGQVTSRWQRTGRWSDDTWMKRLAQWCKNNACTPPLCREPSLVYPCWWVGSDTACSVLNVSRMSNTLAVLGLEGESKCMLKSLRIGSLPWWGIILEEVGEFCHEHRVSPACYVCWGVSSTGRGNVRDREQWVWLQSVQMMCERRGMRWCWWRESSLSVWQLAYRHT